MRRPMDALRLVTVDSLGPVAAGARAGPFWRSTRVDPVIALRQ